MAGCRGFKLMEINSNGCFPGRIKYCKRKSVTHIYWSLLVFGTCIKELVASSLQGGPPDPVIHGVSYDPCKWPKINGFSLGVILGAGFKHF